MSWEVGQKVIISDTQNRIHEAVVTKIARVNFYVRWHGRDEPFDIKSGFCKNKSYDFGHGVYAYSVERYAQMQRREELRDIIRKGGLDLNNRATLTDEQLEAIAAIVTS